MGGRFGPTVIAIKHESLLLMERVSRRIDGFHDVMWLAQLAHAALMKQNKWLTT